MGLSLMDNIKLKNVILKEFNLTHDLSKGLDITHRIVDNGEVHMSLVGTKAQINTYLQNKPVLSDRLRTLDNVPMYRIINTEKKRIY